MAYHHLTYEQRCQIYTLKSTGMSQKEIAMRIGVSPSTICRELKRNAGLRGYRYKQAHANAVETRRQASARPIRMTPKVVQFIEEKIREKWRPDQISGLLKANGTPISHEWIYV